MKKNSSHRRQVASRANGARSHGPTTPEGKNRVQAHAIRHGLLAKCVVLENENPEAFKALVDQYVARFSPVDDVEFGMIEEMAACYWRLRRIWAIETQLMDDAARRQSSRDPVAKMAGAFTELAGSPPLALMSRYESRLHRMFQRAMKNLLLLRDLKSKSEIAEEPNPVSEHPLAAGRIGLLACPAPTSTEISETAVPDSQPNPETVRKPPVLHFPKLKEPSTFNGI